MDYSELKMNVSYVLTGDKNAIIDPIWQEFVDHILSVGSTDHMHFAMKHITASGSDTFKELRDEEISRRIKQVGQLYRSVSMRNKTRESPKDGDEESTDLKRNGSRRSFGGRRSTVDSRRGASFQSRRSTREPSISESQEIRKVSAGRNNRDRSPNTVNNSQDPLTNSFSRSDSSKSSETNESKRNSQPDCSETRNSTSKRKISMTARRSTVSEKPQNSRKISTTRDILNEMEMEDLDGQYDGKETDGAVENETGNRSSVSCAWRAIKRDMQEKHLEQIKEEDPGGWKLAAQTAGHITDAERARQRLYAKYILGHETPWHDGLQTYEQYKHVIEDAGNRQNTKFNSSRSRAPVTVTFQQSPVSVSISPRRKAKTAGDDEDNSVSYNKTTRRPSTCPPFRLAAAKRNASPAKSTYEERKAQAELHRSKSARVRTTCERS